MFLLLSVPRFRGEIKCPSPFPAGGVASKKTATAGGVCCVVVVVVCHKACKGDDARWIRFALVQSRWRVEDAAE